VLANDRPCTQIPPQNLHTREVPGAASATFPGVFNPCLLEMRVENSAQVPITGKFENAFTGKQCPTPR